MIVEVSQGLGGQVNPLLSLVNPFVDPVVEKQFTAPLTCTNLDFS